MKLRKKKEKEDKESIPDQLQLLYFEDVNGLLIINRDSKKNLSEEDKDMIVNEISLVIQNIISFFYGLFRNRILFLKKSQDRYRNYRLILNLSRDIPIMKRQ